MKKLNILKLIIISLLLIGCEKNEEVDLGGNFIMVDRDNNTEDKYKIESVYLTGIQNDTNTGLNMFSLIFISVNVSNSLDSCIIQYDLCKPLNNEGYHGQYNYYSFSEIQNQTPPSYNFYSIACTYIRDNGYPWTYYAQNGFINIEKSNNNFTISFRFSFRFNWNLFGMGGKGVTHNFKGYYQGSVATLNE